MKTESAIFYSFRVLSLNVKWSPLHVERASPSGCWQNCSPHLILHVSKVSVTPVSCLLIGSFRIFLYNHSLIYKYLVYHFSCFNRSCFMSTGHRMLFSIVCSSQNWWKGCSIDGVLKEFKIVSYCRYIFKNSIMKSSESSEFVNISTAIFPKIKQNITGWMDRWYKIFLDFF